METPPKVVFGLPTQPAPAFGHSEVSSKKILVVGIIVALFSWVGGMVYALAFIYKKETLREALVILLTAILSYAGTVLLQ